MKRIALTLALLASLFSFASSAQAADRFAIVKVVNTSELVLSFEYRFGNGPWLPATLYPGQWTGCAAPFTAPNSYRHEVIQFRFDEDLSSGFSGRQLVPTVMYLPDEDYDRATVYHFGVDGATGRFCDMFLQE